MVYHDQAWRSVQRDGMIPERRGINPEFPRAVKGLEGLILADFNKIKSMALVRETKDMEAFRSHSGDAMPVAVRDRIEKIADLRCKNQKIHGCPSRFNE